MHKPSKTSERYQPPAEPMHVRYVNDVVARGKKQNLPRATSRPVRAEEPTTSASQTSGTGRVRSSSRVMDDVRPPISAGRSRPALRRSVMDSDSAMTPAESAVRGDLTKKRWSFQREASWRDHWLRSTVLIAVGLLFGGLSLFSVELGQVLLVVYAVVSLWRRWPSRQSFSLAVGMLAGIIVAVLIRPWQLVAETLAMYAFMLLCLGVLQMGLEIRRERRAGLVEDVIKPGDEAAAREGAYVRQRSL